MSKYYSTFKNEVILDYMEEKGLETELQVKNQLGDFKRYVSSQMGDLQDEIDRRETEMEDWVRLFNEIEVEDE